MLIIFDNIFKYGIIFSLLLIFKKYCYDEPSDRSKPRHKVDKI